MVRIGVVGASGFIGNRAVEMFHQGDTEVRPIGRTSASFDRLTNKDLDCRVASAFDQSSLEAAFKDCDVIIHSILGSPGLIRGSITPTYRAAQKAGVRRIIYLSSMTVHRPAPAPGTTEATPFIENQPYAAHPAKIDAERKLLQLRQKGRVEIVIFRPGIVFGPRSRWVIDLANQLSQGTAYFVNEGNGICNSVYVDNLVHAMRLAILTKDADGEAFFVGDQELVTWFDFYRPFAEALGINPVHIPQVAVPAFKQSWKQRYIDLFWNSEGVQRALTLIPDDLKQTLRKTISKSNNHEERSVQSAVIKPEPVVTQMMAELQQSQYKLPFTKAEKILGYKPIVAFEEGCSHSVRWLAECKHFNLINKPVPRAK
ncbi:NAD(P)-dependent oxidoreductase [Cyanobacteria bacterium FACHB-63]|nr:NAD(P)-dependent oxidoreductase [Cyanobacteria bacterium FACHB-63]